MAGPAPTLNPWSRRAPDPLQSQRSSTGPTLDLHMRSSPGAMTSSTPWPAASSCWPTAHRSADRTSPHGSTPLEALLTQVATPAEEAPQ